MQYLTYLSAAAATITAVSASDRSAIAENKNCDKSAPHARIINRCDYPVNIWSVWKTTIGCPHSDMVTLKTGESYYENYASTTDSTGISIKISKTDQCKGNDITQLEYYLEYNKPGFNFNYLDVSYVDCVKDCPTKQEGYYLQSGTQSARTAKASLDNTWCPILRCSDSASCAKMSYILPDDVQTKTCDHDQNMEFYMCGSHAPSEDDYGLVDSVVDVLAPVLKPVLAPASSEAAAPEPSSAAEPSSTAEYEVQAAAAVTLAPEVKDEAKSPKIRTQVVYVTATEYVNAKRHEHGHAHAHAARHNKVFHA